MSEQQLSVAVIGAGLAGRTHAAAYRKVNARAMVALEEGAEVVTAVGYSLRTAASKL